MTTPDKPAGEGEALKARKFPDLLSEAEGRSILTEAEQLWEDLRRNELGGFSGINRPFYILAEFRRVIEKYGNRDVGLTWSKNDLDAAARTPLPPALDEVEAALKSASSWLERWAVHVGNCRGGMMCTCGLTAIRYEAKTALSAKA